MDNCPNLLDSIRNSNYTARTYLKEECQNLLKNVNLTERIESALPYGAGSDSTDITRFLIESMQELNRRVHICIANTPNNHIKEQKSTIKIIMHSMIFGFF